jgi:hypothetical protein
MHLPEVYIAALKKATDGAPRWRWRMWNRSFVTAIFASLLVSIPVSSQTVVSKNSTAVKLLSAAVSALASGTSISDVTLTGTVTRTAGSDVETGSATLQALGGAESSVSLNLSNGQRTEIINQSQRSPEGQYSGPDGALRPLALHNCLIPASWFFPALALQAALNNPSIEITYLGPDTLHGESVQHIRFWWVVPSQNATAAAVALIGRVSAVDVYLDASTNLPAALDFSTHPDNAANINFANEIRYSDYQTLAGLRAPMHIQRFVNNTLLLDLYVSGLTANSNLSPSDFAVSVQRQ